MSEALKVALTFTAADLASGVVTRFRNRIVGLAGDSKKVARELDQMNRSLNAGIKTLAVTGYAAAKFRPAVGDAAELQQAMLQVKRNIIGSVSGAAELREQLGLVRDTASQVSSTAPLSAADVIGIQNSLLKAGLDIGDIVGKNGAAAAATALATLSETAPDMVGDALANLGTQFNLKGEQFGQAADWLARVDDAAATSLPLLLQGIRMSGASAAAMNIDLKDTVTALGVLSPLGERAGSSLDGFLRGLKQTKLAFEGGNFIGLEESIDRLKEKMAALSSDQERLVVLQKAFGDEGGRAALTFLSASKGFQEIEASAERTIGLTQKMQIDLEGYNRKVDALSGSWKTMRGTLFKSALEPMGRFVDLLNSAVSSVTDLANKSPGIGKGISALVGGGIAAGGAFGLFKLLQGGLAGSRALRGIGGVAGLAAGVAKGKAIEAATGVQPVFVINWPAGGIGGAGGIAEAAIGSAAGARGAGALSKLGKLRALLFSPAGAGLAASGAAGYGVGTLINAGISKTLSAVLGRDASLGTALFDLFNRESADIGGTLKIEIDSRGQARVREARSNSQAVDIDVSTGPVLLAP